jgi:DNA adenine methylase
MKYMGSKSRIAKYILPIILQNRTDGQFYVEPMVGGANLIQFVEGNRIGNDINFYLVSLLKEMQLGFVPPYLSKSEVNIIKNNKELYPPYIVGWASIGCSYSGKWFGGYAGTIITKEGKVRDYISEAIKNLKIQSEKINGVKFYSKDYRDIDIPTNSIIYFDPPYKNTEGYRTRFNHIDFYDHCRIRRDQGHNVFVSEYGMPEDFKEVWSIQLSSSLSSNGKSGGNKKSIEKLFKL